MNCKKLLILVALFFLGSFSTTQAQSVSCPPNIDFELGSLAYWNFYIGTCCPINTPTLTAPIYNRHMLTPITGAATVDSCCSFPVVPPSGGGSYALKLGSRATGAQAEKGRYYVHVPVGVTNYSLVYRYAIAMQYPTTGHDSTNQPRFQVRAYDSASGANVPCGVHNYVASAVAGLPGFFDTSSGPFASTSTPVRCKPWSTEIINLSGYAGQTVVVDFANGDCALGGHYAYGYVDMTCGLFAANGVACGGIATLTGPVGFAVYQWYDSTTGVLVGSGSPLTVPVGSATTYRLVMSPYPGYGCPDTLYTKVIPSLLTLSVTPNDTVCYGSSKPVTASASDDPAYYPLTYSWAPATGLSCTSCPNPIATPSVTTTYTVTVTCSAGCFRVDSVKLTVQHPHIDVTSAPPTKCDKADGWIQIAASPGADPIAPFTTYTVTYTKDGIPQTSMITSSGTGVVLIPNLTRGTYSTITISKGDLCPFNSLGPIVLSDPTHPVISFIGSNTPICVGSAVNFTSTTTAPVDSFRWVGPSSFTSAVQNPSIGSSIFADSGNYILTVAKDSCFATALTVVKIIPVPQPSVSNNTPICEYDTLRLFSSSANGATSYSWSGPNAFSSLQPNPVLPNPGMIADGTYTVTISLGPCQATATTTTTINPRPAAPAVEDTVYCQYDVAVPMVATGTNLLWYTSPTGGTSSTTAPTPNTTTPGTYVWYVTQTTAAGCVSPLSQVTARVFLLATPSLTVSDTVICAGSHIMVNVANSSSDEGYKGFVWTFSNGDSIKDLNPLLYTFESAGAQTVTVTAKYTVCPDQTMSKTIMVYPQPFLNLGPDQTICPGSKAIILGEPDNAQNARWIWNTEEKTSSISIAFPGTYYAKKTINGCTATDTVLIERDCYMTIPNAFTPNGDGVNDYFFPRSFLSRGLTIFEMSIYNRWGELVFQTKSTDGAGWDGKYNNVPQPQGVFVYVIDATFKDGQKEHHQGNITLIR